MSSQPQNPSSLQQQILTEDMFTQDGIPILGMSDHKYVITEPNGNVTSHEKKHRIALMDGTLWSPYSKSVELGGVCDICRDPPFKMFGSESPAHGLCSKSGFRRCSACGAGTCPRHRRRNEGAWLCPTCTRRSWVTRIIRALLFKRVDD